jgi:hypothetical protein
MKTIYVNPGKNIVIALLATIILLSTCTPALAQQHVIADKDNTRPEINNSFSSPAFITGFSAQKWNGYNEIKWTATREQETRKYTVEYSTNGIDFQSAGEVLVGSTSGYSLKHHTTDDRAFLYRVRIEQLNGRSVNSAAMMLEGEIISPVSFYPTIVTGNTININAGWPVERLVITSGNGAQVFTKELNGQSNYIPVVIPTLAKGIYFMSFYGTGWKTTEKFIIP